MRLLLAWVTYLAHLLAIPFLLTHPKLRRGIRMRLGVYGDTWARLSDAPRLWVHGASAGDILALLPTVRALAVCRPDAQIIATTITNSGYAILEKHRGHFAAISYMPYDVPWCVRRALDHIRPSVLVLEYTELWPQLIDAARRRNVSLVLHNGRLSKARLRSYKRMFKLFGNLLMRFDALLMRDESELERALALGAPEGRVVCTGNTKFDNLVRAPSEDTVQALREAMGFADETPLWVAGSTHEGEDDLLLDAFAHARERTGNLRLVIAPRYAERAPRIASIASRRGFRVRLRSQPGARPDVFVVDTIGELTACYCLATIVFVGGSFVPRGGQNILEPAACGKPVLFGPDMHNFEDAVQVLLGRGGIQVASPQQLKRVLTDLLARPEHCRQLGTMAQSQVRAISGAARRNADHIARLLPQGSD